MAGLMDSLSMATRSLAAAQAGLAATGQNIANINTPGYTRRSVDLVAVQPVDSLSAGAGVDVVAVRSARAELLEGQLLREQPAQGREAAMAKSLSQIESTLGPAGGSVDASLTKFFTAFTALAQDPSSGVARQQVTAQGQSLASTFNSVASRLTTATRDADTQVKSGIDEINVLAAEIASYNAALGGLSASASEGIRDKLGVALGSLSKLIDIGVTPRTDGGVDVSVGGGHALVIGATTFRLAGWVDPLAGTGLTELKSADGAVITNQVTGGEVGGVLQVRDVLLPDYTSRLDQLAYDVATSVNTVHKAGFDLSGSNTNINFFTPPPTAPPATVTGVASGLTMSAAIIADSSLIAAAGTSVGAGDNQNARALANLQQTALPGGTTNPIETWGALVYRVGSDAQVATHQQRGRDEIVRQLQTLRDQISGVSLDEEAANLTKFQRAYEANARYFSAIQTSLDVLMAMVG